jgi:hypothetical protein
MTPREKAWDLILNFAFNGAQHHGEAKNFALISIDERIYNLKSDMLVDEEKIKYWEDVRDEVLKHQGLILKKMELQVDKRMYIHPKEMDYISYALNSKSEFSEDQRKWFIQRISVRLSILQPLVNECTNKGLSFNVVDNDLNNEYNDLIFLKNKFYSEF